MTRQAAGLEDAALPVLAGCRPEEGEAAVREARELAERGPEAFPD